MLEEVCGKALNINTELSENVNHARKYSTLNPKPETQILESRMGACASCNGQSEVLQLLPPRLLLLLLFLLLFYIKLKKALCWDCRRINTATAVPSPDATTSPNYYRCPVALLMYSAVSSAFGGTMSSRRVVKELELRDWDLITAVC